MAGAGRVVASGAVAAAGAVGSGSASGSAGCGSVGSVVPSGMAMSATGGVVAPEAPVTSAMVTPGSRNSTEVPPMRTMPASSWASQLVRRTQPLDWLLNSCDGVGVPWMP